jgi:hypothetical protein
MLHRVTAHPAKAMFHNRSVISSAVVTKSAYKMQFEGHIISTMPDMVWRPWAPPKCKLFAWLIIQNRVWTADRLQKRGWPSCVLCKLCNQVQESADHLLYKCRFTTRIWIELKEWLDLHDVDPRAWHNRRTVKEWWTKSILQRGHSRKAMASLAMLVSWEIWKERNARVFQNSATTSFMLIAKIKDEMAMWCHAGAKALCILMPRE